MLNEKGFTLIEMLIVLFIISVLLLVTIPNITKSNEAVEDKGCEALVELVETQMELYKINDENGKYPESITELTTEGYLESHQTTCPNGDAITIEGTKVIAGGNTEE